MVELREGIDRGWLERAFASDPSLHAFALWDIDHAADRCRFISLVDDGRTVAYLLFWYGDPQGVGVHWVGEARPERFLLDALPPRPALFMVPPAVAPAIRTARGPTLEELVLLQRIRSTYPDHLGDDGGTRRLLPNDRPALDQLVAVATDRVANAFRNVELSTQPVWGRFEAHQLVAAAAASIRLARLWFINAVFVDSRARGRGHGRRVTAAAVRAARAAGADAALFVRAQNHPAVRAYASVGFETVHERLWMDAGTGILGPERMNMPD